MAKFRYTRVPTNDPEHDYRYRVFFEGRRVGTLRCAHGHPAIGGVIFSDEADEKKDFRQVRAGEREVFRTRKAAAEALLEQQKAGGTVTVRVRRGGGYAKDAKVIEAPDPTTNARTALNRLCDYVGIPRPARCRLKFTDPLFGETTERLVYRLRIPADARPWRRQDVLWETGNQRSLLARLVQLGYSMKKVGGFALTYDEMRAVMGLTDTSFHGLAGWEEGAIEKVLAVAA